MAGIEPDVYGIDPSQRFENDEIATLETLAEQLPEDCVVLHSLDWVIAQDKQVRAGEIDICVVSPAGRVVIIEQKNGSVSVDSAGKITKHYRDGVKKHPSDQLDLSRRSLKNLWKKNPQNVDELVITPLIYLPDHVLGESAYTAIDQDLVIDAERKDRLVKTVYHLLKLRSENRSQEKMNRVLMFLRNRLQLIPRVESLLARQNRFFAGRQKSLSRWVRSLDFNPRHLLVEGGAGTGKTQLAIELFQQALDQGKRPLLLCYNRPLADGLQSLADGNRGVISNIDRFSNEFMQGQAVYDPAEKTDGDLFRTLREMALENPIPENWLFDVLILDEGQDFSEESFAFARHFLRKNGEITVCRDQQQNIYGRGFDFHPTVGMTLESNYRCSLEVIRFTDALLARDTVIHADSLSYHLEPKAMSYQGDQGFMAHLITDIKGFLAEGFSLADMVVLSGSSLRKSWIMRQDRIGSWPVRRFTGEYSPEGDQLYTSGELLVDTIYRFKGQQRPIVLLVETDFDTFDEKIQRKLYTACTRAQITVHLYLTKNAEAAYVAHREPLLPA